jgi:hypothetical protein
MLVAVLCMTAAHAQVVQQRTSLLQTGTSEIVREALPVGT